MKMNPHPVPEHLDKIPAPPTSFLPSLPKQELRTPDKHFPFSSHPSSATSVFANSIVSKLNNLSEEKLSSSLTSNSSSDTSKSSRNGEREEVKEKMPSSKVDQFLPPMGSPSISLMSKTSPPLRSMSLPVPSLSHVSITSPFPSAPPIPSAPPPSLIPSSPFGPPRDSILPTKMIEHEENLEQYMEIDRSETSKLQQLVDNLENKVSDPNQCVICHRVLSCKSALQMHYRIHTGERPFKCKICSRSFTTKGNLKTHMGVHRMKPPIRMMHQCPICHKSFTNLLVLQQHIRSHAGIPTLPPMPDMSHFHMYHNMNQHMVDMASRAYDLSMKREQDKELDLSKSSLFSTDRADEFGDDIGRYSRDDDHESNDDCDEEKMHVDEEIGEERDTPDKHFEMDQPSGDSGTASDGQHSGTDEPKDANQEKKERPQSASSSVSHDSGRSPSPSPDTPPFSSGVSASMFASYPNLHSTPIFSTSLAALENSVRNINSSMNDSSLSRLNQAYLMNNGLPTRNGDRNSPPTTPNGLNTSMSDNSSVSGDGSKPGTPALSIASDVSSSSGLFIGGLDLRGDSSKRNTTCNICYKTFACRSALEIHYRSHTKERPYQCKVCDRSFTTRGNMKQHMLTHKIRDLPKTFDNNSTTNSEIDNNSLDSCDNENRSSEGHIEQGETKGNDSEIVNKPSSSDHPIKNHSEPEKDSDKSQFVRNQTPLKHQCRVCQKGFSSASALQIHIRTHTGDKPFKCTVCGKAFTTKGNLKVHMGTHMWNNSPSRRGRRMSIEPPFMMSHKDNPYMSGFAPRAPEFPFPFQFPPFMNGMPPKMNEMSVIQGMAGGMGHIPMSLPADLTSPHSSAKHDEKQDSWRKDEDLKKESNGELDLSMKSSANKSFSPSRDTPNSWSSWKTSCHLCGQNFLSPTALDHHMQTFHMKVDSHNVTAVK